MRRTGRKRCRCGHHALAHSGPGTECYGHVPAGENALGVKLATRCTCREFRPSSRSWWRQLWHGTEEQPAGT